MKDDWWSVWRRVQERRQEISLLILWNSLVFLALPQVVAQGVEMFEMFGTHHFLITVAGWLNPWFQYLLAVATLGVVVLMLGTDNERLAMRVYQVSLWVGMMFFVVQSVVTFWPVIWEFRDVIGIQ